MRLIHITDPHLTSLAEVPLRQRLGKRTLGYLSWLRHRRRMHRPERLAETVAALRAERPDLILLGGDLCHLGLPAEIVAAGEWLRALVPPQSLLLVPGNHDLYCSDSHAAVLAHWRPWLHLPAEATGEELRAHYPVAWQAPGLSVFGLCSAVPTPPLLASGRLGGGQLRRLQTRLEQARARGDAVCVLIHHPPLPGQSSRRKALTDAAALRALLLAYRVDLVVHGHLHANAALREEGVAVYATASASSCDPQAPAAYRLIEVEPAGADGTRLKVTLKVHGEGGGFEIAACESWCAPRRGMLSPALSGGGAARAPMPRP